MARLNATTVYGPLNVNGTILNNGGKITLATNAFSGDFNAYTLNSDVTTLSAASNAPFGLTGWYNLINIRHRGGLEDGNLYGGQMAFGMNSNPNILAYRSHDAGTWNAWKKIYHTGNLEINTSGSTLTITVS